MKNVRKIPIHKTPQYTFQPSVTSNTQFKGLLYCLRTRAFLDGYDNSAKVSLDNIFPSRKLTLEQML